jgi:hypothetical protein
VDTREKIKTFSELRPQLQSGTWTVAVGQFDPLTARVARRLQILASRSGVVALVQPGADPILPAETRATMLAALRYVRAVAIEPSQSWRAEMQENPLLDIAEDQQSDLDNREDFESRVARSRHGRSN